MTDVAVSERVVVRPGTGRADDRGAKATLTTSPSTLAPAAISTVWSTSQISTAGICCSATGIPSPAPPTTTPFISRTTTATRSSSSQTDSPPRRRSRPPHRRRVGYCDVVTWSSWRPRTAPRSARPPPECLAPKRRAVPGGPRPPTRSKSRRSSTSARLPRAGETAMVTGQPATVPTPIRVTTRPAQPGTLKKEVWEADQTSCDPPAEMSALLTRGGRPIRWKTIPVTHRGTYCQTRLAASATPHHDGPPD